MNKKTALLMLAAGCACLLAGCGKKSLIRDYSKYMDLAPYTGQTIDRYTYEVTDEDVQSSIQDELSFSADYKEITGRAAKDGDLVIVDYDGTIDGEPFEGSSEEDAQIELGSDTYIGDFEDAIVGMKVGEEKDFDLTFPTPYDGELDGKTAKFHVALKSIVEVVLPEYNDEYVASISDYTTTAEYEAALKEELIESNTADADETACEEFLSSLIMNTTFQEAPDDLTEACQAALDAENASLVEAFGLNDISEIYGDDYDPQTELEEFVHERMVIYTVATREKLEVTDEEYKSALEEEMEYSDYLTLEEYESEMVSDPQEYRYTLLRDKVMDFFAANNTYNDITEEEYFEEGEDGFGAEEIYLDDLDEMLEEDETE